MREGSSLIEARVAQMAAGTSAREGAAPRRTTSAATRTRHGGVRQKNLDIETEGGGPPMNADQRAAMRRANEIASRGAAILRTRFSGDEAP
ncbi:MAG: hypothetical protein IPK13_17685 [Deltaproteobacteria bacterium]|nr:hypothetical protein [Deltaproteobacteria bacterium]